MPGGVEQPPIHKPDEEYQVMGAVTEYSQNDDSRQTKIIIDPLNPMQTARMFADDLYLHGYPTLYFYRSNFYWYAHTHYRETEPGEVHRGMWTFLEGCSIEIEYDDPDNGEKKKKVVPYKPNRAAVVNVTDALAAVCQISGDTELPTWVSDANVPGSHFPAIEFLAVTNGLLHIPSGQLYPPTPAYFGLNASHVKFDPQAKAPEWQKFLKDVFQEDAESRNAVQEYYGYCLTPDTSQQKGMFFVGPPRGGKGILSRMMRRLLGASNVTSPTFSSLGSDFGLQPLIGKLLVTINDIRIGRSDPAKVCEVILAITGEDDVSVKRKFLSNWDGMLKARFLFISNELPQFTDSSAAIISRFIVIQFTQSWLNREDKTLEQRLETELSGILNWAIEGYRRLHRRGHFVQPKSAEDATQAMEDLASPIKAFIRDCCTVGPNETAEARILFEYWSHWCDGQSQYAGTAQQFGKKIRAAHSHIRMIQHPRRYVGISLDLPRIQSRAQEESKVRLDNAKLRQKLGI